MDTCLGLYGTMSIGMEFEYIMYGNYRSMEV